MPGQVRRPSATGRPPGRRPWTRRHAPAPPAMLPPWALPATGPRGQPRAVPARAKRAGPSCKNGPAPRGTRGRPTTEGPQARRPQVLVVHVNLGYQLTRTGRELPMDAVQGVARLIGPQVEDVWRGASRYARILPERVLYLCKAPGRRGRPRVEPPGNDVRLGTGGQKAAEGKEAQRVACGQRDRADVQDPAVGCVHDHLGPQGRPRLACSLGCQRGGGALPVAVAARYAHLEHPDRENPAVRDLKPEACRRPLDNGATGPRHGHGQPSRAPKAHAPRQDREQREGPSRDQGGRIPRRPAGIPEHDGEGDVDDPRHTQRPVQAEPPCSNLGRGTEALTSVRTPSTLNPSTSAEGERATRCRATAMKQPATSDGAT